MAAASKKRKLPKRVTLKDSDNRPLGYFNWHRETKRYLCEPAIFRALTAEELRALADKLDELAVLKN